MTKTYTTAAIILRGASYGEGNRIYTFYSRDRGKFSAVARGVRKQKSKLKGHLQLGNCCDLELIKGKGLDIVSSAAARETFPANREKAEGYFYMSYFLELCNDFTPEEQADAAIYDLLRGCWGHWQPPSQSFWRVTTSCSCCSTAAFCRISPNAAFAAPR